MALKAIRQTDLVRGSGGRLEDAESALEPAVRRALLLQGQIHQGMPPTCGVVGEAEQRRARDLRLCRRSSCSVPVVLLVDVAIAVGGCAVDLIGFSQILSGSDAFPPWVIGYAAIGFAILIGRRWAPRTVYTLLWIHSAIAAIAIPVYGPVVGVAIALYTVSDRASRLWGRWALAGSFLPAAFLAIGEAFTAPPGLAVAAAAASFTVLGLVNAGAWSLGRWSSAHREQVALLDERRRRAADESVAQERARIARDLHDVVSHSVGVMTLQAAGARQVLLAGESQRAAQALTDIQDVGTQATAELRRMLGVLRADGDEASESDPRPGVAQTAAFVDGMLALGVPAKLVVRGQPGELDPSSDIAAYRIVQESLTNVVKHVGEGVATLVELHWSDTGLDLSITNAGPERAPATGSAVGGYGLIGLRERAMAAGGHLDAALLPDGGFRVEARLPVRKPRS